VDPAPNPSQQARLATSTTTLSMPRFPRPWSKKRGDRLLSGILPGIVGEVAFFAFLFLVGVFVLSLVLIEQFAPEQAAKVPTDALETDLSIWVFGILSLVAIATGGAGLWVRIGGQRSSDERRSMLAERAEQIESEALQQLGSPADSKASMPSVPAGTYLTDSPGERLRFRLAADLPADMLAGAALLALLWNSVWFVLLAVVVAGFLERNPRPIVAAALIPFGWIGYWSFKRFLTQLRQRIGIGPTIVEISDHPLRTGEVYFLYVCQTGRCRLKRLSVDLVCQEESFYRQGTDLRIERSEAYRQVLCQAREIVVDAETPWEQQLEFSLPDNAMHSFVAAHNAIRWKLVVQGETRPWPSFCRSFPVIVHPPELPLKRSPR